MDILRVNIIGRTEKDQIIVICRAKNTAYTILVAKIENLRR